MNELYELTYDVLSLLHLFFYYGTIYFVVKDQFKTVFWARIANERLLGAVVLRWWEQWVHGYFESVFQHVRYDACKKWRCQLQTRICVDLNEIEFEFIVNHEIEAENFKSIHTSFRVQLAMNSAEDISGKFVHLWQEITLKTDIYICVIFVQICLKFIIGHLVPWLVLSIAFISLLDSIIGQMDKPV